MRRLSLLLVTACGSAPAAPAAVPPLLPAPARVAAPVPVAASPAPAPGPCVEVGTMKNWRYSPSAAVLGDGRVLVTGGRHHDGDDWLADAEIFDPRSGQFSAAPPMHHARAMHASATLPDGRVVVAGGHEAVEIFDPTASRWKDIGKTLFAVEPGLTVLDDGRVLVAGGDMMHRGALSPSVRLWDPRSSTWKDGASDDLRSAGDLFRQENGRVLARNPQESETPVHEYDPGSNTWRNVGASRWVQPPPAVCDPVERLVVPRDGRPRVPLTYTCEDGIVERVGQEWRRKPFVKPHVSHAAVLLDDGRLFVVGNLSSPSVAELCPLGSRP